LITEYNSCVSCQFKFGRYEFSDYLVSKGDNRINCSECQTRNYLVVEAKPLSYKLFRLFANLLWLIGFALGVWIIELALSKTPYFVISITHFVMGFLGALLGVFIGKFLKKILRWYYGGLKAEDSNYDYDM